MGGGLFEIRLSSWIKFSTSVKVGPIEFSRIKSALVPSLYRTVVSRV